MAGLPCMLPPTGGRSVLHPHLQLFHKGNTMDLLATLQGYI